MNENEIEIAREEVRVIFEKIIKNNQLSIALIQRKLSVGYLRASRFVEKMESKHIVKMNENGQRIILDNERLVSEAVEYFSPEIRDEDKINELNSYDTYVFAVRDEFDADNVDYYWLVRLITENFAKDDEYVKMIDYVFDTDCLKIKDISKRARKILENYFLYSPVLSIVTLQYFADKLKYKTLKNSSKINIDFKEKLSKLRFFSKEINNK